MHCLRDSVGLVYGLKLGHCLHKVALDGLLTNPQDIRSLRNTSASTCPSQDITLSVCEMAKLLRLRSKRTLLFELSTAELNDLLDEVEHDQFEFMLA